MLAAAQNGSGSEMLDGRWAGFGYATSTGAPIWPEGCREGYHMEIEKKEEEKELKKR